MRVIQRLSNKHRVFHKQTRRIGDIRIPENPPKTMQGKMTGYIDHFEIKLCFPVLIPMMIALPFMVNNECGAPRHIVDEYHYDPRHVWQPDTVPETSNGRGIAGSQAHH